MRNNIKNLKGNQGFISIIKIPVYIIVLIASMDIFSYYFSTYLTGFSVYSVLFATVFLVIFNYSNLIIHKFNKIQNLFFIIWASIYIIIAQFFTTIVYSNNKTFITFNVYTLAVIQVVCVFIIYSFLNSYESDKIKINIIRIMIFSLVIDAIVTLRALTTNHAITRLISTSLKSYDLKGASSYEIIYSIVIILPLLYFSLGKFKRQNKVLIFFFITLMIYFVYKSDYTFALIAIVLGIILYSVFDLSTTTKIVMLPLIMLLIINLLDKNLISNALYNLSNNININAVSIRLKELSKLVSTGKATGDSLMRFTLYKQSIDAFIKYPITGILLYEPSYYLSGHSSFLDILGGCGLAGFIPYILFIYYSLKVSLNKVMDKRCRDAIKTAYIIFCFIGFVDNLSTSFTIMLFFLFFINWYPIYVKFVTDKTTISIESYTKLEEYN